RRLWQPRTPDDRPQAAEVMNTRFLRAGIAGGMTGGAVMAAFSMITLWLAGSGVWTPLNLIAPTPWRSAPPDGKPRDWFALSGLRSGASQPVILPNSAAAGGRQMIMLARHAAQSGPVRDQPGWAAAPPALSDG